ncbi:MAG TPA: hypothetical protein VMF87_31800 [Streptosporangiaceae bacterium]|nr:hypothetical protein [Streptosporangiaceae bacterium]
MSTAILVALISGLVAVASVVLSSYATVRTTRTQHELELRRHKLDRSDAVEEVMSRYRDPLLRSAIDLQGRVYSIVQLDFMQRHLGSGDPEQIMYAKTSTLFRLAEYFGWVEILRRGVQFLDLGDQARSRSLTEISQQISLAFANTHEFPSSAFRLFRDEQRAVGELVIEPVPGDPRAYHCIGYTQFVTRLEGDPAFSRWFTRLATEIDSMIKPPDCYLDRLTEVHDRFGALLEFLDPDGIRYPSFKY